MGQKNQLFVTVNAREDLAAIGAEPGAAAAFRAVALVRGPALAAAHADLHRAAWEAAGVRALPPRWRAPWPETWRTAMSWNESRVLALAGLALVHPRLARVGRTLFRLGRVKITRQLAPHTRASTFGPPRVYVRNTNDSETALMLAHELGHAGQMARHALGPSRPAPALVAAELSAHVAERGFHKGFRDRGPQRPAAARIADDMLTMLVRHPARDLLEHSTPEAWPEICTLMAPEQAWSADAPPHSLRALDEPLSTLGYAMAATLATVLFDRIERDSRLADAYLDWVRQGPAARFEDAAALVGGRVDDPGLYDAGYALAIEDVKSARRLT